MAAVWLYSPAHKSVCKVLETQSLWGQTMYRVWLPNQDSIVTLPESDLRPLQDDGPEAEIEAARISYVAAAAKVAETLEGASGTRADSADADVLLAPMESNVLPLPHQLNALARAVSREPVRYLLADEVGLGKTIEAGLVIRELKLRGLVRRILVVSPKGIATQWVSEMQTHFNEHFRLVLGEDIPTLQRLASAGARAGESPSAWGMFDQVVVSLDSVKPIDKRRGWTPERIADYNRSRFEDLVTADWDLVVVDEAHHLGGSTDQVARYKLGKELAEAAPHVLLLSATPHQGKTGSFWRLMKLLDAAAFPDAASVSRARVAPYVIRTEKRKAIDAEGRALFRPRRTQMAPVAWKKRHHAQRLLYEAVTDYVREGYDKALRDKKAHIGFLMILMQRLVVSSTRAIRATLERRRDVLKAGEAHASAQLMARENGDGDGDETETLDDLYAMDGQELLDELLKSHVEALQSEVSHVETLLDAAVRCEQAGPDAKAEALIEWIYDLQAQENEPELKVLVFTEFVQTQHMLKGFLEDRGISSTTLNGTMTMDERRQAQETFRLSHRVLVSTDAGGEGLNLQYAHVIVNYDIPWNPMRLEQRIGRVDRIGQLKTVRALNFVFENSVEFRVREVLEKKLSVIFDEFGIDKTGDVLDSAQAGALFEDVFASAILKPETIETSVDNTVARFRDKVQHAREASAVYGISEETDAQAAERLRSHPLPHWVERMTVGYLQGHGGAAAARRHRTGSGWELTWPEPDSQVYRQAVFNAQEARLLPEATLLNLENKRVRELALNLPQSVPGQAVFCATVDGLPARVSGFWGLFEIRLQAGTGGTGGAPGTGGRPKRLRIPTVRRSYISVFLSEEGRLFLPTARHIWDTLQTTDVQVQGALDPDEAAEAHERLLAAAEKVGQKLFDTLRQTHLASVAREAERGKVALAARRRAIERVGLPEVRQFRRAQCDAEETQWRHELQTVRQMTPEIRPLLRLRIGIKSGAGTTPDA